MEGAATNPPKPDATTNPPETVKIQLSEGKGFEVPKQYEKIFDEVPELKKSLLHGDKTIAELKGELTTKKSELEQLLADRREKEDPFANFPSVLDDEKAFIGSVRENAQKEARAAAAEILTKGEIHKSENETVAALVNEHFGDEITALKDKPEEQQALFNKIVGEIAAEIKSSGGVEQIDDRLFTKKGAVESAFSKLYLKTLIAKAEKRGEGKMGEQLTRSSQAGTSIPTETGGAAVPGSTDERLTKDRAGTLDEAFKRAAEDIVERDKKFGR